MKSLWQATARREIRDRVANLTPRHSAKWGRLSAPQMVVHLGDSMRMGVGELKVASKRLPIRYPPLKQLIIYYLPFPKGAPTAPELLVREAGDWSTDLASLSDLVDRFAERDPRGPWPEHPAFGRLSGRAWGVLTYRHIDHHLRQFGV